MKRIAKFHKVSYEQFFESCKEDFAESEIKKMYEDIKLPAFARHARQSFRRSRQTN